MVFSFLKFVSIVVFLLLSDSENARDILLTAKDIGLFNGEYAIFTVDLLLKHDHEFETYEHSHRGSELSHEGKKCICDSAVTLAVTGTIIGTRIVGLFTLLGNETRTSTRNKTGTIGNKRVLVLVTVSKQCPLSCPCGVWIYHGTGTDVMQNTLTHITRNSI